VSPGENPIAVNKYHISIILLKIFIKKALCFLHVWALEG
jgi:hypothetical protein